MNLFIGLGKLIMKCFRQSQSRSVAEHVRSVSHGSGSLPEHLGAMNLSGSETSILSQAMTRAKQLEEEEKAERMCELNFEPTEQVVFSLFQLSGLCAFLKTPPLKKKRNLSCQLRLWSKLCELIIFSLHQTIPSFSTLVRNPPLNIFNIFPSFNVHVFWFSPIWGKFCQMPKQFLKDFVTSGVGESSGAIWFPSVT